MLFVVGSDDNERGPERFPRFFVGWTSVDLVDQLRQPSGVVGQCDIFLGLVDKDTKVSDILREYGDIAAVMETFGVKRVGGFSVRKYLTKALTVERAAKVHRVPLDEFLTTVRTAVGQQP